MKRTFHHCTYVFAALLGFPAAAHHSPAQFDLSTDIVIEGTLREFAWRNPHVYFEIDVAGADGRPATQRVEAGPASNFVALGVDGDSLQPGERVVIQAKPNRAGAERTALGWILTKADGTVIPLHVRAIPLTEPADTEAAGLAGTWVPQGVGFATLAAAARQWPLTETGRAAIEATSDARNASRSQCVPFGPPALMTLPSTVVIEQRGNEIVFTLDVMEAQRTVHLGAQEHPAQLEPSLHGHSIGHWEGSTLVVDTLGYTAHPDGYAFDRPSSASKHVVERFTLTDDRKHIEYEAVVEDPEYLAVPVTHRSQWDYRPNQQPSNLPCDPEVAGRFTED